MSASMPNARAPAVATPSATFAGVERFERPENMPISCTGCGASLMMGFATPGITAGTGGGGAGAKPGTSASPRSTLKGFSLAASTASVCATCGVTMLDAAAHDCGPATPSATSPCALCHFFVAASVAGPKSPSAFTPMMTCHAATCCPFEPRPTVPTPYLLVTTSPCPTEKNDCCICSTPNADWFAASGVAPGVIERIVFTPSAAHVSGPVLPVGV